MLEDEVRVAIDDDCRMGAMSRQRHAQSARVSRKCRCLAIACQRMNDDHGFAFQTLRLIGGADEHTLEFRQASSNSAGLLDVRRDDGRFALVRGVLPWRGRP